MASGAIVANKIATPIECLHYALNPPTSVVITGMPDEKTVDQAFEAARTSQPHTPAAVSALLARTRAAALTGKYELFKTSSSFDGTARLPDWIS